jgi:hypothetical protein
MLPFLACAWHGPVPLTPAAGGAPSPLVVAMDRTAYDRLALVGQESKVLEDGRLELSVQLRNLEADELAVHFDVQFLTPVPDDAGPDEGPLVETSWRTLRIPGAGTETLTVTSQAAGPSTYTVELWVS